MTDNMLTTNNDGDDDYVHKLHIFTLPGDYYKL